jgi:long-subunit fatty acid transport protein
MYQMKRILTPSRYCGAALAGLALAVTPLSAQDVDTIETGVVPTPTQGERPPTVFRTGLSYQAETDIDDGGEFSIARLTAGVGVPIDLTDSLRLALAFRYELAVWDFSGIDDPWENIHTFSLVPLMRWTHNDQWSFYGGPILRLSAEDTADFDDAFNGGGLVGVNYVYSETLTFGGGVAVVSRIEDDPILLPLLTLNWQFADDWRLKLGFLDVTTAGYGAGLDWEFNEDWMFSFGLQFHSSRFRIDAENAVGQEQAGIVYAAATWRATPRLDLNTFIGVAAGGNIQVDDEDGDEIVDTDYDPAGVLGVRLNIRL